MKTRLGRVLGCFAFILVAGLVPARPQGQSPAWNSFQTGSAQPLHFEVNRGQADDGVQFLSRGAGFTLLFTRQGFTFVRDDEGGRVVSPAVYLSTKLADCRPDFEMAGEEALPGKVHYLLGSQEHWITGVPVYARVRYREVYSGVDLIFYGHEGRLKYDFLVAPGADPATIRMRFDDAQRLEIDAGGNLHLLDGDRSFIHEKPLVYQPAGDQNRFLMAEYVIHDDREVGFQIESFDPSLPLIIDPILNFASYLGGSRTDNRTANDGGNGIAVDPAGNIHVAGFTNSTNFPTAQPVQASYGSLNCGVAPGNAPCSDAFITRFNADGTLAYSTYLGGSGVDIAHAVAVDEAGNAYVAGSTGSPNFPVKDAFQPAFGGGFDDAFLVKLDPAGLLVYATYFGGGGTEQAFGVAVRASGEAVLTGFTDTVGLPTVNAVQPAFSGGLCRVGTPFVRSCTDAFVSQFNAAGSALVYSTYLGANAADDRGNAVALDATGQAYVTGLTASAAAFPTVNAIQPASGGGNDAFVSKINVEGNALIYSTYLGGSGNDNGFGIAVDLDENAYVVGLTESEDFFTSPNALQPAKAFGSDGFLTRLNPDGSLISYSSYLGGNGQDSARAVAVGGDSQAIVTGSTASRDFPVTLDALQPVLADCNLFKSLNAGDTWSCSATGLPLADTVNSVAVDPQNPENLYAGTGTRTTNGSLYKSVDGGENWFPSNAGISQSRPAFKTLAVDPVTPSTLYAGSIHSGLYKSTDGGQNWMKRDTGIFAGEIHVVAVNPVDTSRVFACSVNGLFATADGAENWARVHNNACEAIAIDPTNPATLYAGTLGVLKSIDGGANWNFNLLPGSASDVQALAVDPVNPSILYAGREFRAAAPTTGGMFKSTAGGVNWNMINTGLSNRNMTSIAIDPMDTSRVYAATNGGGVFRSADSGALWNPVNSGMTDPNILTLAIDPVTPTIVYAGATGGGSDAFVTRIDTSKAGVAGLLYSSFLGGSGNDAGQDIAVAEGSLIYLTGVTDSSNFPTVNPFQAMKTDGTEAFVARLAEAIRLFFAQFGNGQGFTSETVLVNPSAVQTASGNVAFFDDAGVPLPVGIASGGGGGSEGIPLTGGDPSPAADADSVAFSIPPLGSATIASDGQGDLTVGSAVVSTDHRLGGVVRFSIPGIGIAGVGESRALTGFIVPVRRKVGGINTGIAVENAESQPARFELSLRDQQGTEVENGHRTIQDFPAGGHLAQFIHELFPEADTTDFAGTLVVDVTAGKLAATALELGPLPGQFTTLPVTDTEAGVAAAAETRTLYFAQFGNGLGFTSDTVLANPSRDQIASGNLSFFDDEGLPLAVGIAPGGDAVTVFPAGTLPAVDVDTVPFSIDPLGAVTISTDGLGDLKVGSAVVTTDFPLGGVVRFSIPGTGIAGVGESRSLSRFIVPVRRKPGGINTGIAVKNTGDQLAEFELTLRNKLGMEVFNGRRIISDFPGGGHLARFIQELFPDADTTDFEGTVVVEVLSGSLAATALELGPLPGQFTTLPVTPLE